MLYPYRRFNLRTHRNPDSKFVVPQRRELVCLPHGSKLSYYGSGWWRVMGYAYDRSDEHNDVHEIIRHFIVDELKEMYLREES
jgi:hypothetical protein